MKNSLQKPFLIGVAGGSGSGKSTVVHNIMNVLTSESALCISHDDYYCDASNMSMDERKKVNYDHPSALDTDLLVSQLQELIMGKTIEKPVYDFVENTRSSQTLSLSPAPVILVEGILLYESKQVRDLLDLKIFVDTDDDVRLLRKIQRDMKERGRDLAYILNQYITYTKPMHLEFVEPSKRYADIIIPEGGENQRALELLLARIHEIVREKGK